MLAIFLIAIALASTIAGVKATSVVTLTLNPTQINPVQWPYDAYTQVTLNQSMSYNDYQSITYPSDGLVGLQIQDPNGNTVAIRTLSTDTTVPYDIPATVSKAYLCDGSENQIGSISMPSATNTVIPMIYFSVTNNLDTIQSVLVTLNIYDSNGVPISVAAQSMPNIPATSSQESILDFNIPSWAHYGTAYAYVDVFNNWPAQGGVPLGEEQSFQFTITGGTAFQGGTPPTTTSQNASPINNFNMTFRLAQSPTLGTYKVYSTTNYLDVTGSQTTSFAVAQLADVNGDGVVNFKDITSFVGMYINYYANGVYYPQIDFIHNGSVLNFKDISLFVAYYILAWSN